MLSSDRFDVEKYIKNIDAEIFGIDLHWLPHVHGAFNIARVIKRIHPNSKILMGGFSASYFSEDIMLNNQSVDFILAGDFVEKQLVTLMKSIESNGNLEYVPNLWYRKDLKIHHNSPLKDPNPTDAVFIDYSILIKNAIRYHDIKGHIPYYSWIKNPTGMTLIQRGCQFNCGFCGGSNYAYKNKYFENSPVRRDPKRVVEEIEIVQDTINAPVFIAGDLNQAGKEYYMQVFREIKERGIDLPLLTEYFVPPGSRIFSGTI
ncbi:Fe-S oxidoreductase [mine drainage metagenome]|uniref:Fe-S oxidoreductase n=1 Tax=mine drainage metagenome TaxID=410659 RepID=T1B8J3_9ZZZZ